MAGGINPRRRVRRGEEVTRIYAVLGATAMAGLLAGTAYFVLHQRADDRFAACRDGSVAGGAGAIGGPFTLIDQTGATVTEAQVLAKPSLVYFGYTFCPDVCPVDVARNAEAVDILEERGFEVTPVFISVDPGRDTPEVLAAFADNLHPRMIGLTGSEEQTRTATQAFKAYSRINDPGEEYYLVDHSTFTYLMLPGTGFADFFRREETADQMAARVACFLEAA
jgi:protein SCO1/2